MADQPSSSNAPPLSSPVSVIGSDKFVSTSQFDIIVDRITSGNLVIADMNHNIVLKVKPNDTCFHRQIILLDADDNPIVTIRRQIMTAHDRWDVFKGDSTNESDKIFTTQTPNIIQFKTSVHVFLVNEASSINDVCDYKIKGSWSERNCTVYLGDTSTTIAQMKKMEPSETNTKFAKGKFVVTIYPKVDYAFVVTLIAIVEAIKTPLKKGTAVEAAVGVAQVVGAFTS